MAITQSKVTARGRITVPAKIQARLGLCSGSVLEWDEIGGEVVVRRARRYTSAQVHEVLFEGAPATTMSAEVKAGIRKQIRRRQVRD